MDKSLFDLAVLQQWMAKIQGSVDSGATEVEGPTPNLGALKSHTVNSIMARLDQTTTNPPKTDVVAKAVNSWLKSTKNKTQFLKTLTQIASSNPNFGSGGSVKPGQIEPLINPQIELSQKALKNQQKDPKKAAELIALIKQHKAELKKLKDQQYAAQLKIKKAQNEKRKLSGIPMQTLKYFSFIEKHCGQFLSAAVKAQELLFRGQNDTNHNIYVASPRTDRQPRDSNPEAQRIIDNALTKFGFKALRSNSIFTTSDYNQADPYGTVYAIFPKDGFNFTWSPDHDDLVINDLSEITNSEGIGKSLSIVETFFETDDGLVGIFNGNKKLYSLNKLTPKDVKRIQDEDVDLIDDLCDTAYEAYQYDDIDSIEYIFKNYKAWSKKTGVKLVSDKQLELDEKRFNNSQNPSPKSVIDFFGFTNKNFSKALKSGNEVCISGEYIAVNFNKYAGAINKYFFNGSLDIDDGDEDYGDEVEDDDDY